MRRRVAAIDCGTNSIRLLIADIDAERAELTDVVRGTRIARLGEGVDRTGRLAEAALTRTIDVLREYKRVIARESAAAVRMVATSATRDAENAHEFISRVREVLGVVPEVLTGDEESRLSFIGAARELAAESGWPPPYLVADIGGGSTEFVLGGPDGIRGALSVDIGCVRLTERHLHGDPPTVAEIAAASRDIDLALDAVAASVPVGEAMTLVGTAGTVTTVAGIALGLTVYDPVRIHHSRITAARVGAVTGQLLGQTRAQRLAIGVMEPGREDVIGAGILVLDHIMSQFGFPEILVSEHDILDGIAWSIVS